MVLSIITYNQPVEAAFLDRKILFSIYYQEGIMKGQFNNAGVLPLVLISSAMIVVINALFNTITNSYSPRFKQHVPTVIFYFCSLTFLIVFSIVANVGSESG